MMVSSHSRFGARLLGPTLLLTLAPAGFADIAVLVPSKDNAVFENAPNNSSGQGRLFSGQSGSLSGFARKRALVAFDVAGSLPAGATIVGVTLQMSVLQAGPLSQPTDSFTLHRLLADWGEGTSAAFSGNGAPAQSGVDATWNERFFMTGSAWTAPGAAGDFDATPSATTPVPTSGSFTWVSATAGNAAMIADVQNWLDGPAGNFGWLIVGAEGADNTPRTLASREDAASTPRLTIEFSTAAASPPAVPDGRAGAPLLVDRQVPLASDLLLDWDDQTCNGATGHHLVYGVGSGLPGSGGAYIVEGSACGIAGPPFGWSGVPDPEMLDPTTRLLWFLVLANDGGDEGSWGLDASGAERPGPQAGGFSGQCGLDGKNTANACGRP